MDRQQEFKLVLSGSLGLAAAIVGLPILMGGSDPPIYLGMTIGVLWLLVLAFALGRYRRRGLWLLIGAPFALLWPAVFVLFAVGCGVFGECP